MKQLITILVICLTVFVSGCASTLATATHHNVQSMPNSFVYVPVDIEVSKFGVGSITEIPEWSNVARKVVDEEIKSYVNKNISLISVDLSEMTEDEMSLLEEYTGLYDVTAGAAIQSQTAGAGWEHKKAKFDYTLGPGLKFLKQYTDADMALFVVGQNYVSTGGRKMTWLFAAAFGVAIPLGHSFLHIGLVDINTGEVLWTNSVFSQTLNLRDKQNVSSIVATLFESYPK